MGGRKNETGGHQQRKTKKTITVPISRAPIANEGRHNFPCTGGKPVVTACTFRAKDV